MKRKPFAPEWKLIDEHATKAQLPLQKTKIRVPRICTVCCHDRSMNASFSGSAADGLKLSLALLCERRNQCPRVVSVLVCHDEAIVECDSVKAEEGKEWLVPAMKDGMDAVANVTDLHIPIEVEASVSKM